MRAVLTYHSVDPSGSAVSVSPEAFARHVEWMVGGRQGGKARRAGGQAGRREGERVPRVVGLDELMGLGDDEDAVALTFDDGFASFATEAAPRLAEHGLPATVFVVTDRVGRDNAWNDRAAPGIPTLPLLDWEALGRLAERGVAIGSHTRTHPRLSALGRAELTDQLEESAATIERRLGRRPTWFAYPYGDLSAEVAEATRARYQGAVTTDHRPLASWEDRVRIPRLDAYYFQGPGGLSGWGSSAFRSGVWLRRAARGARGALRRVGGSR
jgi:peptidoglycan/xylan/chitin deacetylase (PgdA/CDA1 family)